MNCTYKLLYDIGEEADDFLRRAEALEARLGSPPSQPRPSPSSPPRPPDVDTRTPIEILSGHVAHAFEYLSRNELRHFIGLLGHPFGDAAYRRLRLVGFEALVADGHSTYDLVLWASETFVANVRSAVEQGWLGEEFRHFDAGALCDHMAAVFENRSYFDPPLNYLARIVRRVRPEEQEQQEQRGGGGAQKQNT